jgi:hypothetical protein
LDDREARELVSRIEGLLGRIEGDRDATEAVQGLVQLYGEALARFVAGADPT